ncbi:MAG: peptidoglycan-binding protein, partial [Eubacteriales bacterium]
MNRYRNADSKIEQRVQTTNRRPHEYTVFDTKTRSKKRFRIKKKNLVFTAAAVFMALTIPIIFATAANTNEVAKMAQVSMQATQGMSKTASEQSATPPAATNGNLTSDLTDEAVVASAAPTDPVPSADPNAIASDTAVKTMTAYSVITPGTNDPFIAVIQQRLMDLDYMDQDDPTTLYGPATTQAIEYFQRKNGLPQDGVAGVETQTVLFSNEAKPYTVSDGDSGPDVQSIQDRLVELGYTVDHTGYFGSDTTKAVKYFQKMNGLSSDGNVGSNTREILYSETAEPSLEYTAAKKAAAAASAAPSKS